MYGIKVKISADEELWVVDFDLQPKLYESFELAQKDILFWGPNAKVEVYGESKDTN